jgi:hypothetical protein
VAGSWLKGGPVVHSSGCRDGHVLVGAGPELPSKRPIIVNDGQWDCEREEWEWGMATLPTVSLCGSSAEPNPSKAPGARRVPFFESVPESFPDVVRVDGFGSVGLLSPERDSLQIWRLAIVRQVT